MLQTTTLISICLFLSLTGKVATITAVDKITFHSNAITMAAFDKVIFNSTGMNHDPDINQTNSQLLCQFSPLVCDQGKPILHGEHCVTFNEKMKVLSIFNCPYFQWENYKPFRCKNGSGLLLPQNLSQLNDRMCGPLNRKGLVCSECADGFGPTVTSFGYRCANCTDAWYGVPLFLFLEFVPITIFYIICLAF